jgi:hypothetical protein
MNANKRVVVNIKPSDRIVKRFKIAFPEAHYYGAATLGSRSKSYLLPLAIFEARREEIKQYGSKSKDQPFIND